MEYKDYLNSRLATMWNNWQHCCVVVLFSMPYLLQKQSHKKGLSMLPAPTSWPDTTSLPATDLSKISSLVSPRLSYAPHKWQANISHALLSHKNHIVVSTVATGAGKSLTFWLPILAGETGISFPLVSWASRCPRLLQALVSQHSMQLETKRCIYWYHLH
jgi:hypothetical protein